MTDPMETARQKIEAMRQAQGDERRAKWARIQAEAPELAELAQACKAEFEGRLVSVELGGERVI